MSVCPNALNVYSFTMWIYLISISGEAALFFSLNNFKYHVGINNEGGAWWTEGFFGIFESTTKLSFGTWYHLAHTFTCFTSGCKLTLYTNGNIDGSTALTSTMTNTPDTCYISHPNFPLDGYIDDLFFYSTPLNQTQIQTILSNN